MVKHRPNRKRNSSALLGAMLLLFALLGRIAAGMVVPDMPPVLSAGGSLDALLSGSGICHAGGEAPQGDEPGDAPGHDCALCPACLLHAPEAVLAGATLPLTGFAEPARPLPPAAAPPARFRAVAAPPRGPPPFV
ncbi:MAG TPA: DUF2946 family protein [Acetobacteraceae bacterium]